MRIAIAGATGLVGGRLVHAARAAGHEPIELSRSHGVDLRVGSGLDLTGVDAVVDVTNAPSMDEAEATASFTAIARHLGAAATAAGVARTVVLSIIGVDRTPHDGYYIAKLAHETATREHAPGPLVLRTTQFHDFAGQMLDWLRDGDRATIPDMPVQPVDVAEVVGHLLELAEHGGGPEPVQLAGPLRERLPDMVARLDPDVTVAPGPVSAEVRDGGLLPGPSAIIAGCDFATWLGRRAADGEPGPSDGDGRGH